MQIKKILTMLVSLALISGMTQVVAQDEEKTDGLAQLVLITAKDGHEKALEDAITAYHHYMADKDGAWRYQWFSVVTGPDTGRYLARSGNHNWADFDVTHDWDEAADAKFAAEVQPHIADADFLILKADDELGIWPESMDGYQYFSLTTWHIKQGKGQAFNESLKKIDATLKAGNWPTYYAFSRPVSGGKGNTITLVSPRKNYADMAPKEPKFIDIMSEAMGGEEEAGAFLAEFSTTYYVGQNRLIEYRAELSDYGDGE